MAKHTPGPWEAKMLLPDRHGIIRKPAYEIWGDNGAYTVAGKIPHCAPIRKVADAELIAAAPDLLAACEAFVETWDKSLQLEKTDVALQMARIAIAKARGER